MDDTETMTPGQIANHTFAYLRRIEKQLDTVTEVLLRHETRLGRIERDVGDVKSDIVLLENQLLSRMNEILGVVRKVDEQERGFQASKPQGSSLPRVGNGERFNLFCSIRALLRPINSLLGNHR